MAVAAVESARDVRELPELPGRKQTVRNCNAQHRREALDVQAILQAQRPELVLAERAGQETARLVAELRDALLHQPLINVVVDVHAATRSASE